MEGMLGKAQNGTSKFLFVMSDFKLLFKNIKIQFILTEG
jgi:hypothetical protein